MSALNSSVIATTTELEWLPGYPFRKPSWRWNRVCYLRANRKRTCERIDDDWIKSGLKFLAASKRQPKRSQEGPGTGCDLPIRAALELRQDAASVKLWKLESLLLTTLPLEEIGLELSLPVEVVECYHHLFFDVKPHLAATDWITNFAIGGNILEGFGGLPLGALWKYFAYAGGPEVLSLIIEVTSSECSAGSQQTVSSGKRNYIESRSRLLAKLLVAVLTTKSDGDLKALVEVHDQITRVEGQREVGNQANPLSDCFRDFANLMSQSSTPVRRKQAKRTGSKVNAADVLRSIAEMASSGPSLVRN